MVNKFSSAENLFILLVLVRGTTRVMFVWSVSPTPPVSQKFSYFPSLSLFSFFFMKLGAMEWRRVTEPDFRKKMLGPKFGQKGAKMDQK